MNINKRKAKKMENQQNMRGGIRRHVHKRGGGGLRPPPPLLRNAYFVHFLFLICYFSFLHFLFCILFHLSFVLYFILFDSLYVILLFIFPFYMFMSFIIIPRGNSLDRKTRKPPLAKNTKCLYIFSVSSNSNFRMHIKPNP